MALSNAERQAKWRERQKRKLAAAQVEPAVPLRNDADARAEGIQWMEDLLIGHYYDTAETFKTFVGESSRSVDTMVQSASARFLAEEIRMSDLIMIVRQAAYERLVEFFEHGPDLERNMSWRNHHEELKKRVT